MIYVYSLTSKKNQADLLIVLFIRYGVNMEIIIQYYRHKTVIYNDMNDIIL